VNKLDQQLLKAHDANDTAALVALYTQAADQTGDINAACFFLTHAYVFALERGDKAAGTLRERLAANGREPSKD
jgi:spore coat protein U-like protein